MSQKGTTVTIQKTSKGLKLQKFFGGAMLVIAIVMIFGRETRPEWMTYTAVALFVVGGGLYARAAWAKWWQHD